MRYGRSIAVLLSSAVVAAHAGGRCPSADSAERPAADRAKLDEFFESHCSQCHDRTTQNGNLAFENLDRDDLARSAESWEKVVRKLATRQMPPKESPRPAEQDYDAVVAYLESALDSAAKKAPHPGRTETFRRLNRTEYQHTVRDLLELEVDVAAMLPADESSHGFDNVTVTGLSPSHLSRYVSAAQKISRLAIGRAPRTPGGETFRVRPDVTQDAHLPGLPLGTRGGIALVYHFSQDAEYEIQVHLMRDRNEELEGLREPHELEIAVDRRRIDVFTIEPPPRGQSDHAVDANLRVRTRVEAGPHRLTVAFLKKPASLLESERQPLNVHFNYYRHPRIGPAVYEVSITGPFEATGPGETPSRCRIFTSRPSGPDDEDECAKRILSNLARRAYRRPVTDVDLQGPLAMYRRGRSHGGFEYGIEVALSSVLVNPNFLLRIERDPEGAAAGSAYRIGDVELASRLSYFLWSSMPDDDLLDLAERGELSRPEVLDEQVQRMLADRRSRSLATNFAGQWLYLRNLDSATPDMRLFPDFDDNLRQAMRQETELFVESILRLDRSVLDLLKADFTFLNERLARHYGVPHVFGSDFRRVQLDRANHRGGLLRQASILTVTSYATRTSPVLRGQWVLKNILGTPPPAPPPNVPALDDNHVSALLPVRERLQAHRANAACASCHEQIDPVGFCLDNFDAVGRWRESEAGQPLDVRGALPDGCEFQGVEGLETALLNRPELFVRALTEKLLTFALGRGVEYYDAPAVRQIAREAAREGFRFSRLIQEVVKSKPFQMRNAP